MASFSAYLEVGGSRYPLTYYDLYIHQQTDALGRPASLTQGGTLTCELHSPDQRDTILTQWMLSPTKQHDGFVHLYREDSKAKLKTISFFNAYAVSLGMHFSASGSGSMRTSLVISPQRIAVGAMVHDNNWPVESHGSGITHTPPTPPKEPSVFSDGLHTVLDVVGMIPVVGELADGANALIYAAEGDYANAAMSAASMIPLAGNVVGAAKLGKRALKVLSFKRVRQLKKFGKLDLMEVGSKWASKLQRGSTGFLGSPRLSRSQLQAFKKQAKAIGAELEVVKDKAMLKLMDAANAQAGFQAHINKLFVRKGATTYEVTHELTHAKHCAELGKDAYGKLSRLEKETYVFEQLMKQKDKLTKREIEHATDYINDIRSKSGLGQIAKL